MRDELTEQIRRNTLAEFYLALDGWQRRAKTDPARWALDKRRIGRGASPLSQTGDIPYTFDYFPFCREPMEQAVSEDVQVLVMQFASGMGKTEIAANVIGYSMECKPVNVMVAYPKDESRDKFSRDVIQRSLIDPTPSIRSLIAQRGYRDSGNTISYKRFLGGSIYMVGAGIANNFRGPRCGMVYAGEIDGMGETSEGDPISLLFRRCEGFEGSIKILEGTPTIKNRSRVESWMLRSDYRKWFVPCRKCGAIQVLLWRHIEWPKEGRNKMEKAVIVCESCGVSHNDRQRLEMVLSGRWKPTKPFSGTRGYWLNGINSTLPPEKGFKNKLHQFAVNAHDAKHSQNPKETTRVWVNTFLAETWQEEMDKKPEWYSLYERREKYQPDKIPKGVIMLVAGTDVQKNRIEVEIMGFGREEESWGVSTNVFFGDPRLPGIWGKVESYLVKIFTREDGAILKVRTAGFDIGYAPAQRMQYEWLRARQQRQWWAMKGSNQIEAAYVQRARRSKADRITLLIVGTNRIKDIIYDRALLANPGTGYCHFPETDEYNEEFFKQLFSENSYPKIKNGIAYRQFVHEKLADGSFERNEALDRRVYAYAALYSRGVINWEAEEKRNLLTIVGKDDDKKKAKPRFRSVSSIY